MYVEVRIFIRNFTYQVIFLSFPLRDFHLKALSSRYYSVIVVIMVTSLSYIAILIANIRRRFPSSLIHTTRILKCVAG
jgi:hypothetical protein